MAASLNVVILAAGEGKRLGGSRPKVLVPLWGRPALRYPFDMASALDPERIIVVVGAHEAACREALDRPEASKSGEKRPIPGPAVEFARQEQPRGTGDAVLAARGALQGTTGPVLVINGDTPLIPGAALTSLLSLHHEKQAAVTVLTTRIAAPGAYGRLVRDATGEPTAIVEAADADDETLAIDEVNAGVWVLDGGWALEALSRLGSDNAQGEVYLTDILAQARSEGRPAAALCWEEPEDLLGFNDQQDLALVRSVLRERILAGHLLNGVEIVDPDTTWIDADVIIAPGARILPCSVIEGATRIAEGCEVGPFSHLREGTVMQAGSEVGNFVETKKTVLGPKSKAKHLTYLGDTQVGSASNIGAGTITANYDGRDKHATIIGDRVFIGSGTVIVAPAELKHGAATGAGAIVTRSSVIGAGEVWVGVPARKLGAPRQDKG